RRLVSVPFTRASNAPHRAPHRVRTALCTGAGMAIARLTDLTYWYPNGEKPALDHVDLNLGDGLTVVTGPSGGGKSTLLRVLNGLVPHFYGGRISGKADVAGADIIRTPTPNLARTVGFVFQDPELQAGYGVGGRGGALGLATIWRPTP